MEHVDLELQITDSASGGFEVHARATAGEATAAFVPPWDGPGEQETLRTIQRAILASQPQAASVSDSPTSEEAVERLGHELANSLLPTGPVRDLFRAARIGAESRGLDLLIVLQADAPDVATLPWEFLSDPDRHGFLGLNHVPLIRVLPLAPQLPPAATVLPLRVLAVIAPPSDMTADAIGAARRTLDGAVRPSVSSGVLDVQWMVDPTWRQLQDRLGDRSWDVFHFIGRGGLEPTRGEGYVHLRDPGGGTSRLAASALARLLGEKESLRLAILAAPTDDVGGLGDFVATATVLVHRGVPGVVTIPAALSESSRGTFWRAFYPLIAGGKPTADALADSRGALATWRPGTLDWAAAAVFTASTHDVLFDARRPEPATKPDDQGKVREATSGAGAAATGARGAAATKPVGPKPTAASAATAPSGSRPVAGRRWSLSDAILHGGYVSTLIGAWSGVIAALLLIPAVQDARIVNSIADAVASPSDATFWEDFFVNGGIWIGLWVGIVGGGNVGLRLFRNADAQWTTFLLGLFALGYVFFILRPLVGGSYSTEGTAMLIAWGPMVVAAVTLIVIVARGITRVARTGGP